MWYRLCIRTRQKACMLRRPWMLNTIWQNWRRKEKCKEMVTIIFYRVAGKRPKFKKNANSEAILCHIMPIMVKQGKEKREVEDYFSAKKSSKCILIKDKWFCKYFDKNKLFEWIKTLIYIYQGILLSSHTYFLKSVLFPLLW